MDIPQPAAGVVGGHCLATPGMSQRPVGDVVALLLTPVGAGLLASFALDDTGPDEIEALYDRYASVVFSLALRIVRDRQLAEEILEEVFLRVWRLAQGTTTMRGTVLAWLMEMTRAVAIEAVYDRDSSPEPGEAAWSTIEDIDGDPSACVQDTRRAVARVLAALPPEQRQAIELAYFDGLTDREIAVARGVRVETVRGWLRDATRAIGASLRKP
jgi:RNA polymerase sigma-70 factor (ECF subfamily)